MARLHIRPVRLRKWFPPNDPVATAVAMLCVLREDFLIELYGIVDDQLGRLDDNDAGYRRTYFWRNSLRTLEEIKNVMNRLNSHSEFRDAMSKEPPEVSEAFEGLKSSLNKGSDEFLRVLRNTIGGHLDEEMVQATLDGMDPLTEGLVQIGRKRGEIHYKFGAELLWAALSRDTNKEKEVIEIIRKSADLNPALAAIDHVVNCYFRDRALPWPH
jgi:hypothetical protein